MCVYCMTVNVEKDTNHTTKMKRSGLLLKVCLFVLSAKLCSIYEHDVHF